MKRKIALLLATVMTLSTLSMNAFAASTNRFSKTPGYLPENSLMPQANSPAESLPGFVGYTVDGPDDLDYVTSGTDLILELKDGLNGGTFSVELDGAEWYLASGASLKKVNGVDGDYSTNVFDLQSGDSYSGNAGKINDGIYTKYGIPRVNPTDPAVQVGYTLRTSGVDSKRAIVDVNGNYQTGDLITIPLIIKTTTDGDVKVVVNSGNTTLTGGTYVVGRTSSGNTNTWVDDPETARDSFAVDLYMKETRVNALKNGSFELRLPTGFEWEDHTVWYADSGNTYKDGQVRMGISADLQWSGTPNRDSWGYSSDYTIEKKRFSYGSNSYIDEKVLVVTFKNLSKSTSIPGELKIEDLRINADENAPWGDFNIGVYDETKSTWVPTALQGEAGVKEQSIKAGTRTDWNLSLKASGTVPTLFTGRYENEMANSEDASHKTAKVIFKENARAAWWSNRQTVFELPEGVKFRKVDIHDIDDITDSGTKLEGVYTNNGVKNKVVTVDGRTMTWGSLSVPSDKKAKVEIDMWVSIESGFEGDITLTATGTAVPTDGNNELSCVIAHTQDPIEVTTEVRDVKIGYQYQQTADIVIKETAAGALLKGREVRLTATDLISPDMYMTVESTPTVEGDLKISNFKNGLTGASGLSNYLYSYRLSDGSIAYNNSTNTNASLGQQGDVVFEVQSASSKASTITIKNVAVKVDRTAPETNDRPIKLVVWGTAVAANFGSNRDMFSTPGITTDYINNVTAADGSYITAEVRVKIGDKYVSVNGEQKEMDATAYISPESNSTMVPVRFVANAFDITDDQIVWDGTNKTATIMAYGKVVQMTAGVTDMIVNGSKVPMVSPDNKAVAAEIKGEDGHERMYIPFRAIGNAFGVPVSWDSATQTAIYNAK